MLPVIWRPKALAQLDQIGRYIAARNPEASDRLQAMIERTAENLPHHPNMYRPGRMPGTREAVVIPITLSAIASANPPSTLSASCTPARITPEAHDVPSSRHPPQDGSQSADSPRLAEFFFRR